MRVLVLGSAAGGGFPQWNCSCSNCRRVREGKFPGSARLQAELAWSATPGQWALLNASPDLRVQIESNPDLWPHGEKRHSPITDVVLTSAEADQTLGLLLIREFHKFEVHSAPAIRRILMEDNSLFGVLARFPGQVRWNDIPLNQSFSAGKARLEAIPLPGSYPGFVGAARLAKENPDEANIGLLISPESGGATMAYLPGVGSVSDSLMEKLRDCAVIFFDGTFWTDEEPLSIPGVGRKAREMGHMPISGPGGSLDRLASLGGAGKGPRKIFIHINNTNPILDEKSEEHRIVRESGWEIARDGMEIEL